MIASNHNIIYKRDSNISYFRWAVIYGVWNYVVIFLSAWCLEIISSWRTHTRAIPFFEFMEWMYNPMIGEDFSYYCYAITIFSLFYPSSFIGHGVEKIEFDCERRKLMILYKKMPFYTKNKKYIIDFDSIQYSIQKKCFFSIPIYFRVLPLSNMTTRIIFHTGGFFPVTISDRFGWSKETVNRIQNNLMQITSPMESVKNHRFFFKTI